MKKEYIFNISKDMNMLSRETIMVSFDHKNESGLHFLVTMDKICEYMTFLIIVDPKGQLRLQKLLGYGKQNISITTDSNTTTIGGVPGNMISGEWQLFLGVFKEYIEQKLGDNTAKIWITVTEEFTQIGRAHV